MSEEAESMLVCVTDPVKKTESLNTHICYRVRTQIRGAIVSDVERRYNNFKLLTEHRWSDFDAKACFA